MRPPALHGVKWGRTFNFSGQVIRSYSITLCLALFIGSARCRKTLYTAGFFPLSGEKSDIGLGILPAVQLALDDITENDVIPGYKLDLVGNDTMVSEHVYFVKSVFARVPAPHHVPCVKS